MNTTWQAYLNNQGAHIENDKTNHFGELNREINAATHGNVIADLSHFGLISATGDDAQTFLHNQFTNDLKQVDAQHSQLSAYCNPKGRMLALFRVFKRNDIYYLSLPRETLDATLKRLRMFVLMSKVSLDDASASLVHIGISGPDAPAIITQRFATAPGDINEVAEIDSITIIRVAGPQPRYELYGALTDIQALWENWRQTLTPVGASAWELLDIRAGLPVLHGANVEAFVPQMVNLEAVGGLSFTKGCYPGQEIVARMKYLGKLKRRMYLAHVDTDAPPEPSAAIMAHADSGERKVGEIVTAQNIPQGGVDLLAVIEIESATHQPLFLGALDGPAVQLQELPYPVDA